MIGQQNIYLYFSTVLDKLKIKLKVTCHFLPIKLAKKKKKLKHENPELVESGWKRTLSHILDRRENCYKFLESYLVY